jgi:hypothetical protein
MQTNLSKSEIAVLRECVNEAWEAELHDALEGLFEDFSCWADDFKKALLTIPITTACPAVQSNEVYPPI